MVFFLRHKNKIFLQVGHVNVFVFVQLLIFFFCGRPKVPKIKRQLRKLRHPLYGPFIAPCMWNCLVDRWTSYDTRDYQKIVHRWLVMLYYSCGVRPTREIIVIVFVVSRMFYFYFYKYFLPTSCLIRDRGKSLFNY